MVIPALARGLIEMFESQWVILAGAQEKGKAEDRGVIISDIYLVI